MKKIFLALSIFAFLLAGCSETEPIKPKSENLIKKETKEESKKTATNIVHALSTYLYEDGLKTKDSSFTEEQKEEITKKYEKFSESNKLNINSIAVLLGEEPISLDKSEAIILTYIDSIYLDINSLSKSITHELVLLNKNRDDESKG